MNKTTIIRHAIVPAIMPVLFLAANRVKSSMLTTRVLIGDADVFNFSHSLQTDHHLAQG
jgi:hypothetical protein